MCLMVTFCWIPTITGLPQTDLLLAMLRWISVLIPPFWLQLSAGEMLPLMPCCVWQGLTGGTTVSGTMIAAHMAGIHVFVTGGIGGVHRGAENSKLPWNLWYKLHLIRQWNCRSFRCSWSIVCRRCSNYIFILDLTPDSNILHKDNCKTKRETFDFWYLVPLILNIWQYMINWPLWDLNHWDWVTHLCIIKLTIIGSDNGLSPSRRQAIIWTNAGILLSGPLGTNFSEILIAIHISSFKKMYLKLSSAICWRFVSAMC